MKNPLTLAGIEPATFWFVAPHLNHCPTPQTDTVQMFNFISHAEPMVDNIEGRSPNLPPEVG